MIINKYYKRQNNVLPLVIFVKNTFKNLCIFLL